MSDAAKTSDINARVARSVRALRARQRWSLDALASACGVSRSMISLVERGESSPTAVVLEKIAGGFGVPLARLFDEPDATPEPINRAAERSPWRDPASGYVRTNLSPPAFASTLQLVDVMLPPRAQVAYETGPRDTSIHQQIWVREGTVEIRVGATTHRLAAGDCLAMQLDQPTAFRNPTGKRARYLVALATERPKSARK